MTFFATARRAIRPASTLAAALAFAGCSSDILNVGTPDVVAADALGGGLGATTLRNGALQDFVQSFSGSIDAYLVSSENMGDAIQTTDTFADRYFTDGRRQNELLGGATNTSYNNLQLARTGLTSAIQAWTKVKSSTNATVKDSLSELYALRGYTENHFAEGYCSGVPFSSVGADGSFQYGNPLTTAQMLAVAGSSFDSATTLATAANARSLAAVGKARVLVNLGQYAQAATAVASVPTTFRYQVFHSSATARQNNGVFNAIVPAGSRLTAGTKEGTNGIDYLTTPADPRAPWAASTRIGFDGTSRNLPVSLKYTGLASAVTLADGIEARLIEAEARLQGATQADRDAVFASLNTLRTTAITPAMTPIATAPTTQDAAVDLLFRERAFWLYLTGHRLGDMRRLIRQYRRDQATLFPVGTLQYRPSDTYGTDVNLVVPFAERNNPNFKGCTDRNP